MNLLSLIEDFSTAIKALPGRIYNLRGSSLSLLLAFQEEPFLMVEAEEEGARKAWQDAIFYARLFHLDDRAMLFMPAPDGPALAGRRAEVVYEYLKRPCRIITVKDAVEAPVWKPEALGENILRLAVSAEIDREAVKDRLERLGYAQVPLVAEKGQWSMRGFILDVFPSTEEQPLRVEFFGDSVESIRPFDVETQRSVSATRGAVLMPAVEPEDGIALDELVGVIRRFGLEGDETASVVLSRFPIKGEGADAGLVSMNGLGVLPEERKSIYELSGALKALSGDFRIIVVSSSEGQARRLNEIFRDGDLGSPLVPLGELLEYEGRVSISVGELSSGLCLPGLMILTEREIFGGRPSYRAMKKSKVSGLLATLDDLMPGDYLVHRDHGIGRFAGLEWQEVEGSRYELMAIEYASGDRLYLPVSSIDRIRKYRSEEGVQPKIDRLGTGAWQRTRERVRKKIKEMAEKLLRLYAEREVAGGHSFSTDTELHREFDSFFPYEETPDQIKAVEEIKRDMESERPMDRLLCGDVGYGKTEVAMRAAFKAVYDGKQVAVLVPTTLLCEQHVRIFKQRFAAFPVVIDYLSRFKSKAEQSATLKTLERGGIDIIIATHALLRPGVSFYNLGLLIIDEEHRFGVRQKERLKEIKKGVDVLTLTATPIPRTLHMALSGIRRMSLIETAPEERLAVKSIVAVFDAGLLREAVRKEIERGGQVFFVHNRIQDIGKMEKLLVKTVPDARVAVAHGQMTERALEKTMLAFLNGEIDVLLSTAIIGSGLDIPTANTIIIDMAQRMGLADLYQLKGRVGRSNVRAFAYYFIPGEQIITDEARRRLKAIGDLSYMGAGFRLAMKDLEIRGAGNLLGPEQSGYIHAVGFDMYIEMLERAVSELKGQEPKKEVRPAINIKLSAFIPEDYVEDAMVRLSVYRAVASVKSERDVQGIVEEMNDRFGPPPRPFLNLLRVMKLGLLAERASVTGIKQTDGKARFTFSKDAALPADGILRALKKRVRFFPDGFEISIGGDAYEEIREALEKIAPG